MMFALGRRLWDLLLWILKASKFEVLAFINSFKPNSDAHEITASALWSRHGEPEHSGRSGQVKAPA